MSQDSHKAIKSNIQGVRAAVSEIIVTLDDSGQRIDNFLLKKLKGVPKSLIYRLLRKGSVRVNKGRKKPEYKIKTGDVVRIPPISTSNNEIKHKIAKSFNLDWFQEAILYEDKSIIVINKPSGLAVHSGSGIPVGLIEALKASENSFRNLELVHRLDRETSGCLILAKKRSALKLLQEQIIKNQIKKQYQLLVKGRWHLGKKIHSAPLRKFNPSSGERMVRVSQDGKEAITHFSLLESYANASLIKADLITGRTHQIRVHSAHLNHPIAGDTKYGDKLFNQEMKSEGLKRLFLHAYEIRIPLPDSNQIKIITAKLPQKLQAIIDKMR